MKTVLPWLKKLKRLVIRLQIVSRYHELFTELSDPTSPEGSSLFPKRNSVATFGTNRKFSQQGIHSSIRCRLGLELVWGRNCLVVHFKPDAVLRIGTHDAENHAAFLGTSVNP
jgi:hypothetical protein